MLRAIAHYGQTNASIGQRARGEGRAVRLDAPELARGQTGDTPAGGDEGARRAVADGLGDLLEGDLTGEQLDCMLRSSSGDPRSEEHTSELQSRGHLVCRLLLEKKKRDNSIYQQSPQTAHQ